MRTLALGFAALVCACSASKASFQNGGGATAGSGGAGGATASTSGMTSSSGAGGFSPQTSASGTGGGPDMQVAEVYGHSPDVLYKLDPVTKGVTVVGPFKGCSSVIDIALDENSNMFGTTFGGLYKIDKKTAVCTGISNGSYPNSLSFVPKGTLFMDKEALVGYSGSTYIQIDTVTGQVNTIGALGSGLSSSGDIVSVKNGGTYLTVNGGGCADCLVEVDPKTGKMTKNWGPVGYGAVFGIAFWAGSVYGFDNGGDLFEVSFGMTGITTKKITVPNAPPGLQFWGAGSTTSAPVDKPK
jgi:hypothetical protein